MRLTQTPSCSSSLNTCRASTPIIRNESCAPRFSGSVGVKICVLKLLDDSKEITFGNYYKIQDDTYDLFHSQLNIAYIE
jgi:hypothetical protein